MCMLRDMQTHMGGAIGNSYVRPQVTGTDIRLVTAAKMAGYYDLSEFERGVIVDA